MNANSNTCRSVVTIIIATFMLASSPATAQELSGIKCIVNGAKNASPDAAADYRDSKVFVCCKGCLDKFESKPAAFSTQANHQLVLTGQYVQSKCPISGEQVDAQVTANVGGTSVAFCCSSCLSKVKNAPQMVDRAEMIFGNDPFEKSFVKVEHQPSSEAAEKIDLSDVRCPVSRVQMASAEHSSDHLDGKVFFCCKDCADAFQKSPDKYAAAANQQLAATGQYVQVECPLIGGSVSQDYATIIDGVSIKFCCEKCEAATLAAKSDKQKTDLIFEPKRFARSFKPAIDGPSKK